MAIRANHFPVGVGRWWCEGDAIKFSHGFSSGGGQLVESCRQPTSELVSYGQLSADDKHAFGMVLFGPIDLRQASIPAVVVQAVNLVLGLLFCQVGVVDTGDVVSFGVDGKHCSRWW